MFILYTYIYTHRYVHHYTFSNVSIRPLPVYLLIYLYTYLIGNKQVKPRASRQGRTGREAGNITDVAGQITTNQKDMIPARPVFHLPSTYLSISLSPPHSPDFHPHSLLTFIFPPTSSSAITQGYAITLTQPHMHSSVAFHITVYR